MSEKQDLAYILAKLVYGPNVSWDYHSSLTHADLLSGAETILAAGFHKPRVVERESLAQLINETLEGDPEPFPIHYELADAIMALLSQSEVETKPQLTSMTHDFVRAFFMSRLSEKHAVAELVSVGKSSPQESDIEYAKRIMEAVKEQGKVSEASTLIGFVPPPQADTAPEKAREQSQLMSDILDGYRYMRPTVEPLMEKFLAEVRATTAREALERAARVAETPYKFTDEGVRCQRPLRADEIAAAIRALEPKP